MKKTKRLIGELMTIPFTVHFYRHFHCISVSTNASFYFKDYVSFKEESNE